MADIQLAVTASEIDQAVSAYINESIPADHVAVDSDAFTDTGLDNLQKIAALVDEDDVILDAAVEQIAVINEVLKYEGAGMYVLPSYHDNGNGTVTLGEGQYVTYADDYFTPPLTNRTKAGATYSLTDNATNYIVYTGATDAITVSTSRASINQSNVIPIYTIYREGTELHDLPMGGLTSLVYGDRLYNRLFCY